MNSKWITAILFTIIFSAAAHAQLFVNEVQTSNTATILDEDGSKSDWFEIYNSGPAPVDLTGYYASDSAVLTKWRFPTGTVPAQGFLLVWASSKDKVNGTSIHTNFSLSAGGEPVTLTAPDGTTVVDTIPAVAITADKSYGRSPDGGTLGPLISPTPGTTNNIVVVPLAINFSQQAGFFQHPFSLSITVNKNATIHYTTDGSTPNASSPLYTGPLSITNNSGVQNGISMINQTSPNWKAPNGEVQKATVIRAIAIAGNETTPVMTATYIVNPDFTVPVVSVTTDEANLFDYETGIYVKGKIWDDADIDGWQGTSTFHPANYRMEDGIWEKPVHLEIFETNGTKVVGQDIGMQISGQGSRARAQKSVRFYARGSYGKNSISYQLFPDSNLTTYRRVTLKNPDDNARTTMLRDALAQSIIEPTSLAGENYRPAVLFLNGEYWGLFNMREKANQHYLATHYGADADTVVVLEDNAVLDNGAPGDEQLYNDLVDFVTTQDMTNQSNYNYVKTKMDTENFARYYSLQTYIANTDWPSRNVVIWRNPVTLNEAAPYGLDGRWRWVLHDADYAFGYVASQGPEYNMFDHLERTTWGAALWRGVSRNEEFRDLFVSITADQLRTNYAPEHVIGLLDSMANEISPEMQQEIDRWQTLNSTSQWEGNIQFIRDYVTARPQYYTSHVVDSFGLGGTINLTVTGDDSRGTVTVNAINVTTASTALYFQDVPITLVATPKPGKFFLGWTGAASGNNSTIKIVLSQSATVGAVFADAPDTAPSGEDVWVMRKYPATHTQLTEQQNTTMQLALGGAGTVTWTIDGAPAGTGTALQYHAASVGEHIIEATITGGTTTLMQQWKVLVKGSTANTCYASLNAIPATCEGGIITQDTKAGCRTITCTAPGKSLTAMACEKPSSANPQYIEVYRQQMIGSGLQICIGQACVGNAGFAQATLPVCIALNTTREISFVTTSPGNLTLQVGQVQVYNYSISNPAGLPVGSLWMLDNELIPLQEDLDNYLFEAQTPGTYTLAVNVSSNETSIFHAWTVTVANGTTGNESNDTFCASHVTELPASCIGGSISQDTPGSCRTIVCSTTGSSLQVLACQKQGFFEMYRQTQVGTAIQDVCLGSTCIGHNGYVKSGNFPICTGNSTQNVSQNISFATQSPAGDTTISELASQVLSFTLSNPSGVTTTTTWLLNGTPVVGSATSYTFSGTPGMYNVTVLVASSRNNLSKTWIITVTAANGTSTSTCSSSVHEMPALCTGGSLTQDTAGGCRTIVCENGTNLLQVLACNKPDGNAQYFEMYKQQATGSGVKICLGETCIQNNGYAKSPTFPICSAGNQTPAIQNISIASTSPTSPLVLADGTSQLLSFNLANPSGLTTTTQWLQNGTVIATTNSHLFSAPIGSYNLTAVVTSSQNAVSATWIVNVVPEQNVTQAAALHIAPWFPQGRSYVFVCEATGFTPTAYDFTFGDGNSNNGRTTNDVYYTYAQAGSYNVSCRARNSQVTKSGILSVVVA